FYTATASGGIWKSTDGGATWKPIFDDQPASSIGSMAIAPSDANVIYAGAGEANIRGNVAAGNGIYKSVDGGKTWTHVWKQVGQIGTMVVDPRNADVAFAAVLGHAFGPNPERGVYRTRDGGKTWQQVLKKDERTGASDVALDPSNPNIVFAGFWQARRTPWDMTSGGPGSSLWTSRDGGDAWKQVTGSGLPDGPWGKVGVAVAPSDGRRVYAIIEAEKGGLFRSDDGGETWTLATSDRRLRQRAWYYSTVTVHPADKDEVWVPNVPMLKSTDGGRTFKRVSGIHHGDHHDVWFDPKNPKRLIAANDGGADVSTDGGETWNATLMPISQFYHVDVDTSVPYRVHGAMQDLGTSSTPTNSLSRSGITRGDWYSVGGGEAGHTASDPSDPNIVYAGEYLGYISRYDHRTRQARHVGAWPENPSGHAGEKLRYRFQWTAPIVTSPHDARVVYHAGNVLFRTTDGGGTWSVISPDLTTNDTSKQQWSGGPITGDNTGVETFCTIFAVAESPRQKDLIWAGSDDGLVHVTRDAGKTWRNVTKNVPGLPAFGTVSMIEPSWFEAGTAYLVVDNHRQDDMKPYLWRTADFGETWTSLSARLPQDVYLHAVREDPKKQGQIYLGTERGVMFTTDGGQAWRALKLNLPTVAVHDLRVKDDDLVVGTHGRSIWIFDDLTPVREWSPRVAASAAHVFPVRDTIRWRYHRGPREKNAGENPPQGALMHVWLKDTPKSEVRLEVLDARDRVVRTLSSIAREAWGAAEDEEEPKAALKAEAGLQRAVWDLRWEGATLIRNAKIDYGDPTEGPLVVPGTYTLRLSVDGHEARARVTVKPDPRVQVSQADLEAHETFALEVRDAITRLAANVGRLETVREQLQGHVKVLDGDRRAAEVVGMAKALVARLDELESRWHNPEAEVAYDILARKGGAKLYSRLSPLLMFVNEGDGVSTQGMREVFAAQRKELGDLEGELKGLLDKDLASIQIAAKRLDLPFVVVRE
ncbi:MAG: WD40/YVTN/BNR-like repeat-containing protein, partial [Vicinamibacterales bacterium]